MYGAGDGSTTFNLPNLSLKFPLGASANTELGDTGGSLNHTHTSAAHTHTSAAHTHTSAAHSHPLSDNGMAKINYSQSGGNLLFRIRRSALAFASWTTSFNFQVAGTQPANVNETVGAGLDGDTDSTTPGATGSTTPGAGGSTTPGATGSNNPPYQKLNFIIKT
jgi:microcystin-dependent protein